MKDKIVELAQADDRISARISEIEAILASVLNVSISAALPEDRKLVFGKHDAKWRLLVEDGTKRTPLLSLSRGFRSSDELTAGLNSLLDSALDQIQAMLEDRRRIQAELDQIAERIKKEFGS